MSTEPSDGKPPAETILIRGTEIPVESTSLPQATLRFFVDNPRVYSILRADGDEPSQADIERKLLEMDHVKALIQEVKRDGGLTDPVVVRAGSLEVLEGNSRLAAYRALAKADPIKWGRMKVRLLPEDLDEALIFALLGQYHIRGKKDWAPFEQAGFLYRRSQAHDIDSGQLAQEIGLSRRKVEHLVAVYQFMLDNGEAETSRWSYYDEYLKVGGHPEGAPGPQGPRRPGRREDQVGGDREGRRRAGPAAGHLRGAEVRPEIRRWWLRL